MRAVIAIALSARLSAAAAGPEFDAASVKPSPPLDSSHGPIYVGPKGGPDTSDPARYSCTFCDLSVLISQAYDLPGYRIVSADRLPDARFHIVATVPAKTTRTQFRSMLQNLLADRFRLAIHRDTRQMQLFRLVVAPGGPKLKPHVEAAPPESPAPHEKRKRPPGTYYVVQGKTLADFCQMIEGQLGKPVRNATGLPGAYDFDIWWTADLETNPSAADSPTIYSAIQSLGLKLESAKAPVEVIVVDHLEKTPTDN